MTNYKDTLLKLHTNLQILQQREAKYGANNAPLDLLNHPSTQARINPRPLGEGGRVATGRGPQ